MEKHEELMLTRRQKTLSSISNYVPLHIILNQPAGVTFSITVPKFFTIEQLARQIEAEYAFLVEREVGHSRYPVIECGALFDHIEFDRSTAAAARRRGMSSSRSRARQNSQRRQPKQQQQPLSQQKAEVVDFVDNNGKEENERDEAASEASEASEEEVVVVASASATEDEEMDDLMDERQEAESRGVQLRFSDKVEHVLDRNSTVHVMNIDQ
ncbi:hypothetical protein BGZ65_004543, partial [Modicella reniformis]